MKTICSIKSYQDGYLLLTSSRDSNETKHRNGVVINSGILLKVMERNVMNGCGLPVLKELGNKVGARGGSRGRVQGVSTPPPTTPPSSLR